MSKSTDAKYAPVPANAQYSVRAPEPEPATLQEAITRRIHLGHRVVSQTETTAQLVKPKTFSLGFFLLWAFLGGLLIGLILTWLLAWVGLVVYPVYYLAKRDHQVYLTIDDNGRIIANGQTS